MHSKIFYFILIFAISVNTIYSQSDTINPIKQTKVFSIGGIFLSIGGGLNVPVADFYENSSSAFGVLGRLEYSSTKIFPVVAGAEINYFVFNGKDEFQNTNQLTTFKTKNLTLALTIEYSLSSIFKSTYTIPFITADIKYNIIKREISPDTDLENLPKEETRTGFGIGVGITLFVFDFYVKYNYVKSYSTIGAYTKIKFPILKL